MFEATFANNVPSKSLKKVSLPSRLTVVKLRSKRGVSPQPVGSNELILTNHLGRWL
jgi:hypothetical protein